MPVFAGRSAETQFAGGPQRKAEYLIEMRLVAVPADADADVVFGAEDLLDPGRRPAKCFDLSRSTSDSQEGIGSASCNRRNA